MATNSVELSHWRITAVQFGCTSASLQGWIGYNIPSIATSYRAERTPERT